MNVGAPEIRWKVYRATFDTNVFVRSVLKKNNLPNHLLSLWRSRRLVLVLSEAIIAEVENVLSRSALRRKYGYSVPEAANLVTQFRREASIIEVNTSFELCTRDPTDNIFVDCAILGRVQFLVSTDKDLIDNTEIELVLFEYGVKVIDPQDFLSEIQASVVL